jgi:D-alanyl-D-alanine carboxypeptidase
MKYSDYTIKPGLLSFLFIVLFGIALIGGMSLAQARYAAIVMDADNGKVLYAINPDTRNYPASLTKMMTLYMVFEALERGRLTLSTKLTVSRRAAGMSPSKLGLKKGETITVEAVILALVTKSANDAAVVVAEALGGTEVKFARMMTTRARELGMRRTTFRNASGLPNRRHRSTARDMATLARQLIQNFPKEYRYFSRQQYTFRGRKFLNHNSLLRSFPGTDGIKTGYIRASGFNLAVSAKRGDRRLIAVVFGGRTAKSRDKHIAKLLERGFKKIAHSAKTTIALKPNPARRVATIPPASSVLVAKATGTILHPTPRRATPRPGRKPAPPAQSNEWSIQVGAYGDIAPARLAVHRAITRIPKLNANTRVAISPYYAGKRLMYRARLIGLSRASAHTACLRLERRKIPCIAIPPNRASPSDAPRSQTAKRTR